MSLDKCHLSNEIRVLWWMASIYRTVYPDHYKMKLSSNIWMIVFVFEEVFILYVHNGNSISITLMRLLECCVLHWLLPFFSKLHEKNEKERERARWRQAAVVVDLCCCNKKVRWSREWKKERKNGVGCNKNSKFFGRLLRCVFPSLCGWMERLLIKWNYVSLEKEIVMSLEEQY